MFNGHSQDTPSPSNPSLYNYDFPDSTMQEFPFGQLNQHSFQKKLKKLKRVEEENRQLIDRIQELEEEIDNVRNNKK